MKIAFFHNLPEGGAKRVVFEQVKYLSKKHQVKVFEIALKDADYNDLKKISKVERFYFTLDNNFPFFLKRICSDYKNFYSLKKIQKKIAEKIDKEKFDLVIVHPDRFTQAPFLLRFLKTPSVYFCEEVLRIAYEKELEFKDNVLFIKRWYEKTTRRYRKNIDYENALNATKIIANSNFTKENIKKAYGKEAKVFLLGVDTKLFKPTKTLKESDVLFIGEMDEMEGYDLLDNLISNSTIKTKILSRVNRRFKLKDKDLIMEYNKTKIALALNRNEPFGLIPLEAMACGVPVIAINEGGFRETVEDGKNGFLIKRDSSELISKIKLILSNNKLFNTLSKNGREVAVSKWDWNKRMKEFEKLIYEKN